MEFDSKPPVSTESPLPHPHASKATRGKPGKRGRWRRRLRQWWPGLATCLVFLLVTTIFLALAYFLSMAKFQGGIANPSFSPAMMRWGFRESLVQTMIFWWVIAFCASIGSFLNVVVYRMPRGLSLSAKSSHCVWCQAKIRPQDNIPILGWVLLQGRCFKCRLPISSRYPVVETLTAVLGLILFLLVVQMHGLSLPQIKGIDGLWHCWLLEPTPAAGLILYLYFLILLAALIAAAWISFDARVLPVKLYLFTLFSGLIYPAIYLSWMGGYLQRQTESKDWNNFAFLPRSAQEISHSLVQSWPGLETWLLSTAPSLQVAGHSFVGQTAGYVAGIFLAIVFYVLVSPMWRMRFQTLANPPANPLANPLVSQEQATNISDLDLRVPVSQVQHDGDRSGGEPSPSPLESTLDPSGPVVGWGWRLWECVAIATWLGVFCGFFFSAAFMLLLLATVGMALAVLRRSETFDPQRAPWFFTPYVFLLCLCFWRWFA